MATKNKVSRFEAQLVRTNKQIKGDRAKRINGTVADAQMVLIMGIRGKVREKENELDAMMDLSTDNQTTTMNVISPKFDAKEYVERINKLKVEIKMLSIELSIAEETYAEWFDSAEESAE